MKRLVDKYYSWSEMGRNLFVLLCIAFFGALISLIWIFLDNIGVLLGWLLGSMVNIFAYVTMAKGASYLLGGDKASKQGYWVILWGILRFAFYAGALILAGFCSFKWGSLSHGYCNLISTALALMPTWVTLAVTTFLGNKRGEKNKVPAKKEEKAELTEEKETEAGE